MSATGNAITIASTTRRTVQFGIFEKREDLGGNLNERPTDDGVRDRDFAHVAAL
jgi:hypothetical protein